MRVMRALAWSWIYIGFILVTGPFIVFWIIPEKPLRLIGIMVISFFSGITLIKHTPKKLDPEIYDALHEGIKEEDRPPR